MTDSSNPSNAQSPAARAEPPALHEFDNDFEAARPADTSKVRDGRYQTRLNNVTLDYSRNVDPMLTWDLVVLSGEHARRHIFKNAVITKDSLPFVKADLMTVGLELPRLSRLPDHLEELVGLTLEVVVRTRDEYTNVTLVKLIQAPELEAAGTDGPPF